jgi:hypothetical protein
MAQMAHERAADPATPLDELRQLAQDSLKVAAAVAANPSIDDAVIQVLLKRRSGNISKALASNPSTPFEHLAPLAKTHPEQVLANPAFELMLAADPSCIEAISEESLVRLAKAPSADTRCLAIIARATGSLRVARALLENRATPLGALQAFKGNPRWKSFDVTLHRNWPRQAGETWERKSVCQLKDDLCAMTDDTVWLPLLARAGAIDTSLRVAAIARAPKDVRAVAIARCQLHPDSELILAEPELGDLREAVAHALLARGPAWPTLCSQLGLGEVHIPSGVCPGSGSLAPNRTAEDVQGAFVRHRDYVYGVERRRERLSPEALVRGYLAIASHPHVSASTLEAMINAHVTHTDINRIAARSHAATPHVRFLSRLSELVPAARWIDDLATVRNSSVEPSVMAAFAQHAQEEVRIALAGRPDLPASIVASLAADSSKALRRALAGSESLADESLVAAFCVDSTASVRAAVVGRHGPLPSELRKKLLSDKSAETRTAFASRHDATDSEQRVLALDKSEKVRLSLACNPSLTADAIAALRSDATNDLITAFAGNPAVPLDVVAALVEKHRSRVLSALRDRGAAMMRKHETPLHLGTVVLLAAELESGSCARMIALSHPTCPPDVIERLFDPSAAWPQRALVAANPATPETVRAQLRGDACWPVAEAAASVQ